TDCLAPSEERVVGVGGLPAAKPDTLSEHWKLTVTGVLFQPLAFGAGVRSGVIVGGVWSTLTVNVFAGSVLPALSALRNVIVVMPSVLIVKDVEPPGAIVVDMASAPAAL